MRALLLSLLCGIVQAGSLDFREHTIASDLKGGYQVVAADINGDGKPDLIALASGMTDLVWFENPGWARHVIVSGLSRMINLAIVRSNDDGIPDMLLAHEFSNQAGKSAGILSLLESRGDHRAQWTVREIDRLPTSHRLRTADIDGKGAPVVINAPLTGAKAQAPDYRGHTPLVFYRPGEWKRERIGEENEGVVHGLTVVDWDGDGEDDVLTASFSGIHLYRRSAGRWLRTEIAKGNPAPRPKSGASDIAVGRLGKTRFLASIEPWHGEQLVVYRAVSGVWQRKVIDTTLVDGHTVSAADLNADGRDEIIAGYRGKGGSVYLYQASDESGSQWERTVLDDGGISAAACTTADLNMDGTPDIACIGSATANLKWYKNLNKPRRR
ncbi:MAG: VCBS repeat-containing protein [Bryobacterales bacterium]|nr:VCBS repeat-containing protein [Bryobacterales bacterium]